MRWELAQGLGQGILVVCIEFYEKHRVYEIGEKGVTPSRGVELVLR